MAENASGITPVDTKVLVLPDAVEDRIGSILLPDATKEKQAWAMQKATVIALGASAYESWRGDGPVAGSRVLTVQYAGSKVKGADGKDYWIINDEDICGVLA